MKRAAINSMMTMKSAHDENSSFWVVSSGSGIGLVHGRPLCNGFHRTFRIDLVLLAT